MTYIQAGYLVYHIYIYCTLTKIHVSVIISGAREG